MGSLKTPSRSLRVSIDGLLGDETPLKKEVVEEEEVIYVHNYYTYGKQYRSKLSICGVPLVGIDVGRGRTKGGYWRVIKGIITIGDVSAGVIPTELLSVGLCSLGLLILGLLFTIGLLALSYFAIGCLAIGYVSIGVIAIGVYSIDAISIGFKSAIDALAYDEIAMGTNPVGDIVYHLRSSSTCLLDSQEYLQFQEYLSRESLPKIIEFFVQVVPLC